MLNIRDGGLDDPRVVAMLRYHFDTNISVTPPGSAHVFSVERLKSPDVHFWTIWQGNTLMGTGALKIMSPGQGEVKSMHTNKDARRQGVGTAMVKHIIAFARKNGLKRLSLETGSFEFFRPARELYLAHGFTECPPFGDYKLDPNSTFLMLDLET